ncbi:molybdopterin molybdotransferase MoeA [bacterium]|nr:molybdopterin molybdotransferase MoeA [bacterium]
MIPYTEALERILAEAPRLPGERVRVEQALGRVLLSTFCAPHPMPRFANSAMDGYAVRSGDLASASREHPIRLRVVETVHAGQEAGRMVESGTTIGVMTGGCIPPGADAVVVKEAVARDGEWIEARAPARAGQHVRPVGGDFPAGASLLFSGTRLGSAEIGLLAYVGLEEVEVVERPRVAILSTGDELIPPGRPPHGVEVHDSNAATLSSMALLAGGDPVRLGLCRDNPEELTARLARGLSCHLIVTTGGASVGERDYQREVLHEMGFQEIFYRVAIKPGKPVLFGRCGETLVLALPGNPVSAAVCFSLFAWPLLRAMRRRFPSVPAGWRAVAGQDLPGAEDRESFLRVHLRQDESLRLVAQLTSLDQGSGIFGSMTGAVGLARVRAGVRRVPEGDTIEVLPLLGGPMQEAVL